MILPDRTAQRRFLFPLSCHCMGKKTTAHEATVTALEGCCVFFSKSLPQLSLLQFSRLTDLLAPSVHLWHAAAVRASVCAVTGPSLVLRGVKWAVNTLLMTNASWIAGRREHIQRVKHCFSKLDSKLIHKIIEGVIPWCGKSLNCVLYLGK